MSLYSSKKTESFYFGRLPNLLCWIGLAFVGFNLLIFVTAWMFGGQLNTEILLPHRSGFVFGVVAILLSISIKNSGMLTLILSLTIPILVVFYHQQLKRGIEGITPQLPLEMGILSLSVAMLYGAIFFVALTYKYKQGKKFPA